MLYSYFFSTLCTICIASFILKVMAITRNVHVGYKYEPMNMPVYTEKIAL